LGRPLIYRWAYYFAGIRPGIRRIYEPITGIIQLMCRNMTRSVDNP